MSMRRRRAGSGRPGRFAQMASLVAVASLSASLAMAGARPAGDAGAAGPSRSRSARSCADRPTRRIDVVVNLDPRVSSSWVDDWHGHPMNWLSIDAAATISTEIVDREGRPRRIELHWARRSDLEWGVVVTPPVIPAVPSIYGKLPPRLGVPPESGALFRFDDRGELIGPDEVEVVVAPEPSPGFGSGDPSEVHGEQPLTIRLRTSREATTQYASSFLVSHFERRGRRCRPPKSTTRACFLDPALRGDPVGGEAMSIFVDARGRLVANARQHLAGRRIVPASGALESDVSAARLPSGLTPPRATTRFALELVRASEEPIVAGTDDDPDLARSGPSRIVLTAFDGVGRPIQLELRMKRTGPRVWIWQLWEASAPASFDPPVATFVDSSPGVEASLARALSPDGSIPTPVFESSDVEIEGPDGAIPALEIPENPVGLFSNGPFTFESRLSGGRGRLLFGEDGTLVGVEQEGIELPAGQDAVVLRPAASDRQREQRISLDFGIGRSLVADEAGVLRIEQDGYAPGVPSSLRVTRDFVLEVGASNGVDVPVSALAFAEAGEPVCRLACSNGRDDDRDGRTDSGEDPGCLGGADGSERSPTLVCDDGIDQDGDGLVDFPDDPGCAEPQGDDESPADASPND